MIAAILIGLLLTALFTFVVEVALALKQKSSRPSTWNSALASKIYDVFFQLGMFAGILADVTGWLRRLILQIRRLFFDWIPVDIILAALDDLKRPILRLMRTPLAFFEGLSTSFVQSALPFLTRVIFTFQSTAFILAWQILAMVMGWTHVRPSALLMWAGGCLVEGCYAIGYGLVAIGDVFLIYSTMVRLLRIHVFYWLPENMFLDAYNELAAGLRAIYEAPGSFWTGAREAFVLSTHRSLTVVFGVFVALLVTVGGVAFLVRKYGGGIDVPSSEDDESVDPDAGDRAQRGPVTRRKRAGVSL